MKHLFITASLLMLFFGCTQKIKTSPPNVILIMSDDQGYGDLGFHGNDSISTPNLDQFARESIQFDRFYVSPLCAPTRASLLTGRYHLRTGTTWVTHRKEVMRSEETTLAEIFNSNGYATGCFGKWHNGEQYPNDPNGQGFDEFFGFKAGHWNNYFNTPLMHNHEEIKSEGYIIDWLTDRALDFIDNNKSNPFFCYIPYNTPHSPFQVPDKYFNKYKKMGLTDKNACVYGMVENIDYNFEKIISKLRELNIEKNTIVIFLTDNGPNGNRFNGGMRGIKSSVHEGGVRVPFFIKWPDKLKNSIKINTIASHIDVLPTLAELCGVEISDTIKIDGTSLVPLMHGNDKDWPQRTIFSIQNNGGNRMNRGAARTDKYRFVLDENDGQLLFDMSNDPSEKNNIATDKPEITDSLFQLYKDWYNDVTKIKKIEPVPIGYSGYPEVNLPSPEAFIKGGVSFEGGFGWANDYLIDWKNKMGGVTWKIVVVDGGEYEVYLKCNHKNFNGAKFSVNDQLESTFESENDFYPDFYPSPDRVERGEVYEKDWEDYKIGKIEFAKGEQDLSLVISELPGNDDSVFELKGLVLKKIEN